MSSGRGWRTIIERRIKAVLGQPLHLVIEQVGYSDSDKVLHFSVSCFIVCRHSHKYTFMKQLYVDLPRGNFS